MTSQTKQFEVPAYVKEALVVAAIAFLTALLGSLKEVVEQKK